MKIAKTHSGALVELHASKLNRHGLVCGSTGSGKTITLQKLAELMSENGISVIIPDIKGDLNGFGTIGGNNKSINKSIYENGYDVREYTRIYDHSNISVGDAIDGRLSKIDPILLARMMNLSAAQYELLAIGIDEALKDGIDSIDDFIDFIYGDALREKGLQEFDVRTCRTLARKIKFALISKISSVFSDNTHDLDIGSGKITTIDCSKLINDQAAYSNFLVMLMDRVYNMCDEAGDLDKPRVCLILDEAHLIFKATDAYSKKIVTAKVSFMVKTARSRGIGLFFVTQNPLDINKDVNDQLGLRIQHTMRAGSNTKLLNNIAACFDPSDSKGLADDIKNLKIGEAIISGINEHGQSSKPVKAKILPPRSHIGRVETTVDSCEIECEIIPSQENSAKKEIGDIVDKKKKNRGCTGCLVPIIIAISIILALFTLLFIVEMII